MNKYLLSTGGLLFLGACATSSNTLTEYPPSGEYIGFAYSELGGVTHENVGTSKGMISGSSGIITIVNNSNTDIIKGEYALNNSTCFSGTIMVSQQESSFMLTNCSLNDGVISGNYKTGFGDYGTFTSTLKQ